MLRPILGVLTAIAVTTAMDATGLSLFSALALLPLMLLFWRWDGLSRRAVGFTLGRPRHHLLAVLYPLVVIGAVGAAAAAAGQWDTSTTDWGKAGQNFLLMTLSTILVVSVTEEGFFRGWLWGSAAERGVGGARLLFFTSIAFSLWHVSAVTLETGFDLPTAQIPVYLVNATVMGLGWGLLRLASGSVLVASVSHGLWNGLAYVGFGFGTRSGALGISDTAVWGPEVGVVGLAVNTLAVLGLWRLTRPSNRQNPGSPRQQAQHRSLH